MNATALAVTMIKASVVSVTPTMAAEWLAKHAWKHQRRVRTEAVSYLTGIIKMGDWRLGQPIQFAVLPDGTRYLVNGQHRLHAILRADMAVDVLITEHPCADEEEVDALYRTLDRGRVRGMTDLLAATDLIEGLGLTASQLRNVAHCQTLIEYWWMSASRGTLQNIDALMRRIESFGMEAREFYRDITEARHVTRQAMTNAPTMSVALTTYRWQPTLARRFWSAVSQDDGLRVAQPEHTLLQYLRERKVNEESSLIYARAVAAAWTAAWRGNDLSRLVVRGNRTPIEIGGTPYIPQRHQPDLGFIQPTEKQLDRPFRPRTGANGLVEDAEDEHESDEERGATEVPSLAEAQTGEGVRSEDGEGGQAAAQGDA